jgi:AcrR family transcriptional regulator
VSRAGLTREKVISAAAVLADEIGFHDLTLAALARLFCVRLPSLYSHVASVHELKMAVALLALQRLAERAEEAVAGRAGRDALIALANTHRAFALEHPGLFHACRYPLDPPYVAGSGALRLARTSHSTLRGYNLCEADRIHATRLIGSFVLGFSLLEMAGSFSHSAPACDETWDVVLDGLDALLLSWAGRANIA